MNTEIKITEIGEPKMKDSMRTPTQYNLHCFNVIFGTDYQGTTGQNSEDQKVSFVD